MVGKVHVPGDLFDELMGMEPGQSVEVGPMMLDLAPDPVTITVRKKFVTCLDAEFSWLGVSLGGFVVDPPKEHKK